MDSQLLEIIRTLQSAPRVASFGGIVRVTDAKDEPEGVVFICISDTLAKKWADYLCQIMEETIEL